MERGFDRRRISPAVFNQLADGSAAKQARIDKLSAHFTSRDVQIDPRASLLLKYLPPATLTALLLLWLNACTGNPSATVTVQPTTPSSPTATAEKENQTPIPGLPAVGKDSVGSETPTPEPNSSSTPDPDPKDETLKEAPCEILPQEYCAQAEALEFIGPTGAKAIMIGFRVPAGVKLPMPIDGQTKKSELNPNVKFFKGRHVTISNQGNPTRRYVYAGDIGFNNMLSLNMDKGTTFGQIQNTGIDMGGYNLIFYIADLDSNGREVANIEEMKKSVPGAFAKPAKELAVETSTKGGVIQTRSFN